MRRVGRARFRNDAVDGAARFAPTRWVIVATTDAPDGDASLPTSRRGASTRACCKPMNRGGTRWQVVPAHELED